MSRREANRIDESDVTVTDSLRSFLAYGLHCSEEITSWTLDGTLLTLYRPEQILGRMLSTTSPISTAFSTAAKNQKAFENDDVRLFR